MHSGSNAYSAITQPLPPVPSTYFWRFFSDLRQATFHSSGRYGITKPSNMTKEALALACGSALRKGHDALNRALDQFERGTIEDANSSYYKFDENFFIEAARTLKIHDPCAQSRNHKHPRMPSVHTVCECYYEGMANFLKYDAAQKEALLARVKSEGLWPAPEESLIYFWEAPPGYFAQSQTETVASPTKYSGDEKDIVANSTSGSFFIDHAGIAAAFAAEPDANIARLLTRVNQHVFYPRDSSPKRKKGSVVPLNTLGSFFGKTYEIAQVNDTEKLSTLIEKGNKNRLHSLINAYCEEFKLEAALAQHLEAAWKKEPEDMRRPLYSRHINHQHRTNELPEQWPNDDFGKLFSFLRQHTLDAQGKRYTQQTFATEMVETFWTISSIEQTSFTTAGRKARTMPETIMRAAEKFAPLFAQRPGMAMDYYCLALKEFTAWTPEQKNAVLQFGLDEERKHLTDTEAEAIRGELTFETDPAPSTRFATAAGKPRRTEPRQTGTGYAY